jgi:nucleotide-binding universal stress UspA family protein
MKTILVPLDGSALAEQILPYVQVLAPILGAEVRLLQALSDTAYDGMLSTGMFGAYGVSEPPDVYRERRQRFWEAQRQHAQGYLATRALELQRMGLDVEIDVRIGPPEELIVEAAQSLGVALIAMATHGYSGLRRWTLGSVADKVAHATTTPVFLVRGTEHPPTDDVTLKRILLPLDGSALANQALPLATELATCAQAELVLLQAIVPTIELTAGLRPGRPIAEYGEVLEALRRQAKQNLGFLAAQFQQRGIPAETVVLNGHAAEAIVDEAAQRQVDLIVMATHGYSGLKRWTLGSVADKVLHAAKTPLLLVRARPGEQ